MTSTTKRKLSLKAKIGLAIGGAIIVVVAASIYGALETTKLQNEEIYRRRKNAEIDRMMEKIAERTPIYLLNIIEQN